MNTIKTAILALLLFTIVACTAQQSTSSAPITPSGQAIVLTSDEMGRYTPAEIRVKVGSTVRLEGDPQTLVDGMDTVIVDGYGVSKRIASGDNVIEFVADKEGEFLVHCANGMGNAKLIVEA